MHDPSSLQHAPEFGGGPVIDADTIDTLKELGGEEDPGLVLELIELFLDDAAERMQTMESAWGTGDLETVGRCAHALKSASANIGAIGFSSSCRSVETAAKEGLRAEAEAPVLRCLGMYPEVQSALQSMQAAE